MKFYTLGTSHGYAEIGRACSGNLLLEGSASYLFDCGGNTDAKMTDLSLSIPSIRAVFISHMHEDHVGKLSAIAKYFINYVQTDDPLYLFFPEENGIHAFKSWLEALHLTVPEKLIFRVTAPGEIYSDENVTVTAIPTAHMDHGAFPSYAYAVESAGQKLLYTGDLAGDFHDYPKIVFEETFDAVVCELVHYDIEKQLDTLKKTKTKRMIFTHYPPKNAERIRAVGADFPFPIFIATDGDHFQI